MGDVLLETTAPMRGKADDKIKASKDEAIEQIKKVKHTAILAVEGKKKAVMNVKRKAGNLARAEHTLDSRKENAIKTKKSIVEAKRTRDSWKVAAGGKRCLK